jgi:hypothetical protein
LDGNEKRLGPVVPCGPRPRYSSSSRGLGRALSSAYAFW